MFAHLNEEQVLFSQDAFGNALLILLERFLDDEIYLVILGFEASTYYANILSSICLWS